jgi:hypothetical protein
LRCSASREGRAAQEWQQPQVGRTALPYLWALPGFGCTTLAGCFHRSVGSAPVLQVRALRGGGAHPARCGGTGARGGRRLRSRATSMYDPNCTSTVTARRQEPVEHTQRGTLGAALELNCKRVRVRVGVRQRQLQSACLGLSVSVWSCAGATDQCHRGTPPAQFVTRQTQADRTRQQCSAASSARSPNGRWSWLRLKAAGHTHLATGASQPVSGPLRRHAQPQLKTRIDLTSRQPTPIKRTHSCWA